MALRTWDGDGENLLLGEHSAYLAESREGVEYRVGESMLTVMNSCISG
jgi:hypothetical protein